MGLTRRGRSIGIALVVAIAAVAGVVVCGPLARVRADDKADADAALAQVDKAIKALGEEKKLAQLQSGRCKGKMSGKVKDADLALTCTVLWQGVDKHRIDVDIAVGGENIKGVLVLNGKSGWFKQGDNTNELPENAVPFAREMLYCVRLPQLLTGLKDKAFKLKPVQETMIKDRAATGIWIVHEDHKDAGLYFDKENGLPLKSEIRLNDPQGNEVNFEFFYSDYKEVSGVKHPTKIAVKGPVDQTAAEFELELSEIQLDEKTVDMDFAKP